MIIWWFDVHLYSTIFTLKSNVFRPKPQLPDLTSKKESKACLKPSSKNEAQDTDAIERYSLPRIVPYAASFSHQNLRERKKIFIDDIDDTAEFGEEKRFNPGKERLRRHHSHQ